MGGGGETGQGHGMKVGGGGETGQGHGMSKHEKKQTRLKYEKAPHNSEIKDSKNMHNERTLEILCNTRCVETQGK